MKSIMILLFVATFVSQAQPVTYQEVVKFVKQNEGFSAKPYKCPAGYWTVGWGHRVSSSWARKHMKGISVGECQKFLKDDIQKCYDAIIGYGACSREVALSMVDFFINLGEKPTKKIITSGDYEKIKKYIYARNPKTGGKSVLPGLKIRRNKNMKMVARAIKNKPTEPAPVITEQSKPSQNTAGVVTIANGTVIENGSKSRPFVGKSNNWCFALVDKVFKLLGV